MRNAVPHRVVPYHSGRTDVNAEQRPRTMKTIELCKTSDVDEGSAIKVDVDDLSLAVFNLNGAFYVMDDLCSHGPGSLSEGYIKGDTIECDFHNGSFNIKTGDVVEPPCMIPQKVYKVVINDDTVCVEV